MLTEAGLLNTLGRDSPLVHDVAPDVRSSVLERGPLVQPPATISTWAVGICGQYYYYQDYLPCCSLSPYKTHSHGTFLLWPG